MCVCVFMCDHLAERLLFVFIPVLMLSFGELFSIYTKHTYTQLTDSIMAR